MDMKGRKRMAAQDLERIASTRPVRPISRGAEQGVAGARKMGQDPLQLKFAFFDDDQAEPIISMIEGDLFPAVNFTRLPQEWREEARRRYVYVTELRKRIISDKTAKGLRHFIKGISCSIGDLNPPSRRILLRWHRRFLSSGGEVRSLIPLARNSRYGSWNIQPEVLKIIEDVVAGEHMFLQKTGLRAAWESVLLKIQEENRLRFQNDLLSTPSYYMFRREVHKIQKAGGAGVRYKKHTAVPPAKQVNLGFPIRQLERVETQHAAKVLVENVKVLVRRATSIALRDGMKQTTYHHLAKAYEEVWGRTGSSRIWCRCKNPFQMDMFRFGMATTLKLSDSGRRVRRSRTGAAINVRLSDAGWAAE